MKGKDFDVRIAPLSFIDLEMTGLEAQKHEILEVGLVKVAQPGLEIIEKWDVKVKPEHIETADPEAIKICGYVEDKWKDAISLREMMEQLAPKVKGTILAGWNTSSDYSFLDAAVTKTGITLDFHRRTFDVNSYASAALGYQFGEKGLGTISRELDIKLENHHTALADAMVTYEVYRKVFRAKHQ